MYELALALGKTVAELECLSIEELRGWLAYTWDHPLPDSWLQHAESCQLALATRGQKSKLKDFIPTVPDRVPQGRVAINWAAIDQLKERAKKSVGTCT